MNTHGKNEKSFGLFLSSLGFILLLVLIPVTGCEDDDENPIGKSPNPNEVIMEEEAFRPSTMTIMEGTTITWINAEDEVHSVTSGQEGNSNNLFRSGDLMLNEQFTYTFDSSGVYEYHCEHHQGMTGEITVLADTTQ